MRLGMLLRVCSKHPVRRAAALDLIEALRHE